VDHLLLESLKSICKTSFHHVEINPDTNDTYHIAAYTNATSERLTGLSKIIESSPSRVNIACFAEARAEKK
jgi:hypothetical protein